MVHRRGRLQGWNLCHCFCCANTKFALPKFRNDKICVNTLQVFWVFFFIFGSFFPILQTRFRHLRPWPLRGPFKQVVLKAIAGITALEGAPRGGEVVVFVCLAQVSVTSKHPEVISHLANTEILQVLSLGSPLTGHPLCASLRSLQELLVCWTVCGSGERLCSSWWIQMLYGNEMPRGSTLKPARR